MKFGNRKWLSDFSVPECHLAFVVVGLSFHFLVLDY